MTHALPEPDPQPSTRPELYSLSFWLIAVARVVRGAAVGGTAVLGAGAFDTLSAVPWNGFITGAIIGAIMSLGASLGNMLIPDNTAHAVVARFTSGRDQ